MKELKKSILEELKIGKKTAQCSIVQGGMGVGISRSGLAGAVAAQGGIGIISTAQIGYDEEGFEQNQQAVNLRAIAKHIAKAKEIAKGKGLIGVNVMTALKHYRDHVIAAAKAGADVIVCGAGLPVDLPQLIDSVSYEKEEDKPLIAPIVSSKRATELILKMWDHRYCRTADFLVVEGPLAGGHLGFDLDQLSHLDEYDFQKEIKEIIACKKTYEDKYGHEIPVIVGGGVFDKQDISQIFSLGADGVQIASRFVVTKECDASEAYKQAYLDAKDEDIQIVKSPVGMPGRAISNAFIKKLQKGKIPIDKCYNCLEKCKPSEVPYCITKALTDAVKGDVENGLLFCGAKIGRLNQITTVQDLIAELS